MSLKPPSCDEEGANGQRGKRWDPRNIMVSRAMATYTALLGQNLLTSASIRCRYVLFTPAAHSFSSSLVHSLFRSLHSRWPQVSFIASSHSFIFVWSDAALPGPDSRAPLPWAPPPPTLALTSPTHPSLLLTFRGAYENNIKLDECSPEVSDACSPGIPPPTLCLEYPFLRNSFQFPD